LVRHPTPLTSDFATALAVAVAALDPPSKLA
jgi:hypothetical protein